MKKLAIFCSTPYQVFTAIVMKHSILGSSAVDLYIYDYFDGYEELADRVRNISIFNNVKSCKVKTIYKSCTEKRVKKLIYMFNYKKLVTNYFLSGECYAELYFTILDPVSVMAAKYYCDKNKDLKLYQFEDGLYNYYGSNSRKWDKVGAILGYPKKIFFRKVLYLYGPDMCNDSSVEMRKLNVDVSNRQLMIHINGAFGYDNTKARVKDIIYFDSLGNEYITFKNELNEEICNLLLAQYGREKCMVKLHPRREKNIYKDLGLYTYEYQSIPFEILCVNCNMNHKVLVSTWSTALFAPKILLNQEPYVLLLYYLSGKQLNEVQQRLIMKLQESYGDPRRVMMPKNIFELKECLDKISEEEQL